MVEITAGLVKELREKSGAGMMDCKMALTENDGNIDLSIDWLRAKGITKAAKKSDRIASEGLIGSLIKNGSAAMIELNSETDFVARNDEFQDLLRGILEVSIDNDEVESVQYQDTGRTVAEEINEKIATPMGIDITAAAAGITRVINARMADEIRVQAAKKGVDLSDFTLVPFGGAGPAHAVDVAADLGIGKVLIPTNPGAFSALGLLCADVVHDYIKSDLKALEGQIDHPNHAVACSAEPYENCELC